MAADGVPELESQSTEAGEERPGEWRAGVVHELRKAKATSLTWNPNTIRQY